MAQKELLSVRIPADLMKRIEVLMAEKRRDKTSIAIELVERGLNTLGDAPIESENFVPVERFEAAIASLKEEVKSLKESELAA
jgi:predicted DNA-binding protein